MRRRASAYVDSRRRAFRPQIEAASGGFDAASRVVDHAWRSAGPELAIAIVAAAVEAVSEVGVLRIFAAALGLEAFDLPGSFLGRSAAVAGSMLVLLIVRTSARLAREVCCERAQIRTLFPELSRRRLEDASKRALLTQPGTLGATDQALLDAIAAVFGLAAIIVTAASWTGALIVVAPNLWGGALLLTGAALAAVLSRRPAQGESSLRAWIAGRGRDGARSEDRAWPAMEAIGAHEAWLRRALKRLDAESERLLARVRPRLRVQDVACAAGFASICLMMLARPDHASSDAGLVALAAGVRFALLVKAAPQQAARAVLWAPPTSQTNASWNRGGAAESLPTEGPVHVTLRTTLALSAATAHHEEALVLTFPAGSITMVVCSEPEMGTIARMLIAPQPAAPQSLIVDGAELAQPDLLRWRDRCAFIPAQTLLINDTLEENLRLSAPQSAEPALWNALSAAGLGGLVRDRGKGLGLRLGKAGLQLSPGQARRLSLARALLRSPRLLVVEEPDVGLTRDEQGEIDRVITALSEWSTVVLLTSGHGPVVIADYAIVLEGGAVAEEGRVDVLLRNDASALSRLVAGKSA